MFLRFDFPERKEITPRSSYVIELLIRIGGISHSLNIAISADSLLKFLSSPENLNNFNFNILKYAMDC